MTILNHPTLNDRPLERYWQPPRRLADALADFGRRLLDDERAKATAAETLEWLAALESHQVNYEEFDRAISGRAIAQTSFILGHQGEDYERLMRVVERRQVRLGWRYVGHRWRHDDERG